MSETHFDYTLSIDFERCSLIELRAIAKCLLVGGSSMCIPDFYDLVGEMIQRMRKLGEDLRNEENHGIVRFILDILETLKKMNHGGAPTPMIILLEKEIYMYMGVKQPSPAISPATSPEVAAPKIMKKAKKH